MEINELSPGGGMAVAPQNQNQGYNYALALEQLKRQRAIAEQQYGTKMPEGQMVSGWYVAPKGSQYLSAGLEKLMGAYGMSQADQAEKDNALQSQQQVAELAKALQANKGGFADKLTTYQQLANAGPFGAIVAKAGMEKDLSGPKQVTTKEGEKVHQQNPDGTWSTILDGGQKRTATTEKIDAIKQAYPGISDQVAAGIATGTIRQDKNSGAFVDAATGKDVDYGAGRQSAFPQASGQQPATQPAPASTGPVAVPARGQTYTGPTAPAPQTAFPQAAGKAAPQNSAQAAIQNKQAVELAPKHAAAKDAIRALEQTIGNIDEMDKLLQKKPNRGGGLTARTGPVTGLAWSQSAGNQRFNQLANEDVLARLDGHLGTAISDGDRKFIQTTGVNSNTDAKVNQIALAKRKAWAIEKYNTAYDQAVAMGIDIGPRKTFGVTSKDKEFAW